MLYFLKKKGSHTVPAIDITNEMKDDVLHKGQVMYSERVSNKDLLDSVDESALFIKNTDKANYIGMILNGTKTVETRDTRTLNAFIGKEMPITDGKYVYGYMTIGEPYLISAEDFHKKENQKKHRVPVGDEYDVKAGKGKWAYPIESVRKTEKKKLSDTKDYKYSFQAREVLYADPSTGENVKYSIRDTDPPKKTIKGYKVFYVKDGKLYPPMVANPNGEATPIGVWLNADIGVQAPDSKTGRKQVKAGGKGTQGRGGSLSFRPGWHLGEVPLATQFDRVDPSTGERSLFPKDFVWAECDIAADIDYQEEAMSYGYTKNGRFQHSLAGLPELPIDGYYRYRTNPNPDTVTWIITGAMKVNRLLSDAEVNEILASKGLPAKNRQGGNKTLSELGLGQHDGVRYSERKEYRGELHEWDKEGRYDKAVFVIGTTSSEIQGLGAMESDIYIKGNKINTILAEHPEITINDIANIPKQLDNALLILKSKNASNSSINSRLVIFGNEKASNGLPIMTILDLMPTEKDMSVEDYQKVNSIYTKTVNPVDFVSSSDVLYVTENKKIATSLLHSIGFKMPINWNETGYIGYISYKNQTVNIRGIPFSSVVNNNGNFNSDRNTDSTDNRTLLSNALLTTAQIFIERKSGFFFPHRSA